MNNDLAPYPVYKDSGLPWLGAIPSHWDVRRIKNLLRETQSRSSDGAERLLSVSQYTGVTPRKSHNGEGEPDTRAESLVGYKHVRESDLVVNIMLAWNGSMGVSRFAGIVSPAYCVYRFSPSYQPWYFHELLRLPVYKGRIKVSSTGVVESRLRLYTDDLYRVEALLPTPDEQAKIVQFVSNITQKVDRLIRVKRRLVECLNEQKSSVINDAVTHGLDHGGPLRPSGIDWLGDVPQNWMVVPLRHLIVLQTGITLGKTYSDRSVQTYPYLRVANVQNGYFDLSHIKTIEVPETEARNCMLLRGDVLVTEGGDPDKLGRGSVWEAEVEGCLHQNHIFCLRPKRAKLRPQFLAYLLAARPGRTFFTLNAKQTTNLASTNSSILKAFPVFLPDVDEQDAIISHLKDRTRQADLAIERASREIELIREYRTRLISDVVTGKIDVRNIDVPFLGAIAEFATEDIEMEEPSTELYEREEVDDAID